MSKQKIRIALIGAGIFAQKAHIPALKQLQDTFEVVAIYSRTEHSAQAAAAHIDGNVTLYHDIDALLARDDIDAVDIILPIGVMPGVIERALAAGKHVISEKPMAPDVATGKHLLQVYAQYAERTWMVAENWRHEPAFVEAARVIAAGQIGRPIIFDWAMHIGITPQVAYYHTTWRRDESFPGGFLMDAGVHHIAALRTMLGEVQEVSATITQVRDDLPPADTLSAVLRFENGAIGNYTVTYASASNLPTALRIVGDAGSLCVHTGELTVLRGDDTQTTIYESRTSVGAELAVFADAIHNGKLKINTPRQALGDVAVIEALLRSNVERKNVIPESFG